MPHFSPGVGHSKDRTILLQRNGEAIGRLEGGRKLEGQNGVEKEKLQTLVDRPRMKLALNQKRALAWQDYAQIS